MAGSGWTSLSAQLAQQGLGCSRQACSSPFPWRPWQHSPGHQICLPHCPWVAPGSTGGAPATGSSPACRPAHITVRDKPSPGPGRQTSHRWSGQSWWNYTTELQPPAPASEGQKQGHSVDTGWPWGAALPVAPTGSCMCVQCVHRCGQVCVQADPGQGFRAPGCCTWWGAQAS